MWVLLAIRRSKTGTTQLMSRILRAGVVAGFLAGTIGVEYSPVEASSTYPVVAIYAPFISGTTHQVSGDGPGQHMPETYGGWAWDLHAATTPTAAKGYVFGSSPDGVVKFEAVSPTGTEVTSNGMSCGYDAHFEIRVGTTVVGEMRILHLDNLQVSAGTIYSSGQEVGTFKQWED
jgi:hypothetical protein